MPNRDEYNETPEDKWRRFGNFHKEDLMEIQRDIKSIKADLNGDGEKAGLKVTVKTLEEFVLNQKKHVTDFWTFAFRVFLTIVITYIAYKVGLKPGG